MELRKIEWTDTVIEEFWRYWSGRPGTYFSEAFGATILRFTKNNNVTIGTALDFGAGSGGLLAALSNENHRCCGLEFGQDSIGKLTKKFVGDGNVEAIFGTGNTPKYREFFDTVFLIETIEHMPDRHLTLPLECAAAMLKPGRWLVVSTPNDEDLEAAEIYCPVCKIAFHCMKHVRSWNKANLHELLTEAGFTGVNSLGTDPQSLPYHSKSAAVKRAIKRAFYPGYKDPHFVALAQKPSAQSLSA